MDNKNRTINIGKNKNSYEMPLNLTQMATFLEYFPSGSKRDLKHIFRLFDLDSSSRKLNDNTIEFKTDTKERMQLQIINKALTMELLTSGIFSYIDHPMEVNSNCLANHYRPQDAADDKPDITTPSNFAQGGVPDTHIEYENYKVILEVSAKYQPSLEDFRRQLNGALKHARELRKNDYKKPIYCLLINERSLNLVENKEALKNVLNDINPSEQIYITAISTGEFAEMGQAIAKMSEGYISKLQSDDLHEVLQATVEKGIYGKFHELLRERYHSLSRSSFGLF